ncbi:MAG: hypothetical protein ABR598_03600 [Candidatus Dormibacteria bacterium]
MSSDSRCGPVLELPATPRGADTPPVVPLFLLGVLVLTQLFHTVFPDRVPYLRRLILSVTGMAVGEFAGLFIPGPRLGELHPAWDVLATAILQLAANRFLTEAHRDSQR